MKKLISILLVCTLLMTVMLQGVQVNAIEYPHTYVLRFYDADGTTIYPTITKGYGSSAVPKYNDIINLPTPTREGETFYGWDVGYPRSWNRITSGKYEVDGIADGTFPQTFTIDLYANWGYIEGTLDGNGTLTISGLGKMKDYYWAKNVDSVRRVIIEEGVTSISDGAFSLCTNLESITIPSSITSIGANPVRNTAYHNNNSNWENGGLYLRNFLVASKENGPVNFEVKYGTRAISDETFMNSNIESIIVPDSVISIGKLAFAECLQLESIVLGSGVASIGEEAFRSCSGIKNITVSADNRNYSSVNGVLFDKEMKTLIKYPGGKTDVSYTIPTGVTSISNGAFSDSYNLENITISDNVANISAGIFPNHNRFKSITVSENNQNYSSENGILFDKGMKTLLEYPAGKTDASYTIPINVTAIGEYAFDWVKAFENITIPENVKSIGEYAFARCLNLKDIIISEGVTSICDGAFEGCNKLADISVPNSVTKIGNGAFNECTSLKSVILGNGITSIGDGTFARCSSVDSITIPNGVESIGEYAFTDCSSLKDITIPNTVTSIGAWAFSSCESLESITIPGSLTSIGNQIFVNCTSLKNVTLETGITSIDYRVFGESSIKNIYIPKSVTSIGEMAFDIEGDLDVYYEGNEKEWASIAIHEYMNQGLDNATIHYNSTGIAGDDTEDEDETAPSKTTQTITIEEVEAKTYGGDGFEIYVTTNAANENPIITYLSDKAEVVTVVDGVAEIVGAGKAVITVNAAETKSFTAATATVEVVVNPIAVTVEDIDLDNKTATLSGVLEADISGVELDFDKIKTTVISTDKSTDSETNVTTIISNVKLSNFKLTGYKAENYVISNEAVEKTVSSTAVSEDLAKDENVTVEAAPVDDRTITVTAVNIAEVPENKTISIDVTSIADTKVNTVAISKAVIDNIIGSDAEASLEITLKDGSSENNTGKITFNAEALAAIQTEAGAGASTLSVSLNKAKAEDLEAAQLVKIEEVSTKSPAVYSLSVVDEAGNSVAGNFGQSGAATVTLPYTKPAGNGNIKAKWLEGSGNITDIADVSYNDDNKTVTLKLNHFSEYLIYTEPVVSHSGGSGGGGSASYTIKFETNGGNGINSVKATKNNTISEPTAPVKDGYSFDGWYTDKELTTVYDFNTKVTKSFTLYAKWIENKTDEKPDETDEPEITDTQVIPFIDVNVNDWYYEAVKTAYEKGLMKGVGNTEFGVDANVTRGMFVTVLYRMENEPVAPKLNFTDVESGAYFASAIAWANANNIVTGVTDTEFAPNNNITREQMATILFRYAQYKGMDTMTLAENLNQFADNTEISEYAVSALNWAVGANVMGGKGNGILDPKGFATRAEAAAVLVRMTK